MQLIFGVITEKLRGLIWDLWDSCIDGRARLRRSEGEKRTQVEQTQSGCTNEIGVKRRNFQQYTLTSVKLKKSPMLPTNRSTSPAYCSMMCAHEVQDNGCLWKQLWEDEEEEESWENVRRWWNSGWGWKTKLKQKRKKLLQQRRCRWGWRRRIRNSWVSSPRRPECPQTCSIRSPAAGSENSRETVGLWENNWGEKLWKAAPKGGGNAGSPAH